MHLGLGTDSRCIRFGYRFLMYQGWVQVMIYKSWVQVLDVPWLGTDFRCI